VEITAVIIIFLLLLFGTMEYCRIVFVRQLLENATREGCRFAAVNTNDTNLVADTQAVVTKFMGGMNKQVQNFNVQVYMADSSGNNIGPPTSAQFGQYIAVEIDCDYNPILPSFLFLGKTLHLVQKAVMYSEAN
jgi:Flp pilus assembly protein TadG